MSPRWLLVGCALLSIGLPAISADNEGSKLAGTWWVKAKEGGHDQFWQIKNDGGKWTVRGWYKRDGAETGTFVGEDVKFADGTISYVHKYVKKPSEKFTDNVPATLKAEGDGLRYSYTSAATKGTRLLNRFEEPKAVAKQEPKVVAKEEPKSEPKVERKKEDRFIGRWVGAVEGFDQVWTIRCADGIWSVDATYSKGGVEAGSFAGTRVQVGDGEMTFVRKYAKKPVASWPDEPPVLVKLDGENLLYSYKLEGFKGDRLLRRAKDEPKAEPKATAKQEPTAVEKLAGTWETEYDGMRVVWQIAEKDGKWSVAADYFSKAKGTLVGNWVGVEPRIELGKLYFVARYTKKIPGYSDGKSFVCTLKGDDVLEYRYTNAAEKSAATLRRVKR